MSERKLAKKSVQIIKDVLSENKHKEHTRTRWGRLLDLKGLKYPYDVSKELIKHRVILETPSPTKHKHYTPARTAVVTTTLWYSMVRSIKYKNRMVYQAIKDTEPKDEVEKAYKTLRSIYSENAQDDVLILSESRYPIIKSLKQAIGTENEYSRVAVAIRDLSEIDKEIKLILDFKKKVV